MEWMISAAAGLLAGLVVAYLWMRTKVAPLRATLVLREEECESLKQTIDSRCASGRQGIKPASGPDQKRKRDAYPSV